MKPLLPYQWHIELHKIYRIEWKSGKKRCGAIVIGNFASEFLMEIRNLNMKCSICIKICIISTGIGQLDANHCMRQLCTKQRMRKKTEIDVVGAYFYASVVRKNSSITRVQSNFFASMDNAKRQHCDWIESTFSSIFFSTEIKIKRPL